MDKTCFRNNLSAIGKWGGAGFLSGIAITVFMFGGNYLARAYVVETVPMNSYQPNAKFKLDFNPISKINEVAAPVNYLINSLKFNRDINIGTWVPLSLMKSPSQNTDFSRFFGSSKVSSNDIMNFLKEAAITGINLTILIISITIQILKGLISVLKS